MRKELYFITFGNAGLWHGQQNKKRYIAVGYLRDFSKLQCCGGTDNINCIFPTKENMFSYYSMLS